MSRKTSPDERALFEAVIEAAVPLAPERPVRKAKPASKNAAGGLDGRTAERLRRGAIEPEARLDLHGMTEAVAHRALVTFLRGARMRGARLTIVVTGKGKAPAADAPFDLELDGRRRGALAALVPRWLKEPALAPLVADVRAAHRKHGGAGALYVYLKKP